MTTAGDLPRRSSHGVRSRGTPFFQLPYNDHRSTIRYDQTGFAGKEKSIWLLSIALRAASAAPFAYCRAFRPQALRAPQASPALPDQLAQSSIRNMWGCKKKAPSLCKCRGKGLYNPISCCPVAAPVHWPPSEWRRTPPEISRQTAQASPLHTGQSGRYRPHRTLPGSPS